MIWLINLRENSQNLDRDADVDIEWAHIRNSVYSTASTVLGPSTRKHRVVWREWQSHQVHTGGKTRTLQSFLHEKSLSATKTTAQFQLHCAQDKWFSTKADAIQTSADKSGTKNFYSALKAVYDPHLVWIFPNLSADGSITISDKNKILKACVEHFSSILSRPSTLKS